MRKETEVPVVRDYHVDEEEDGEDTEYFDLWDEDTLFYGYVFSTRCNEGWACVCVCVCVREREGEKEVFHD